MDNMIDIISQLEIYDQAYADGNPIIPDAQYDLLRKEAYSKYPTHPYFIKVGAETRGGKIRLPYPMGSLNQIHEGEYADWINKYDLHNQKICVSHKLDGVSCMVQYKNGQLQIAYSRGDGISGADITRHIKKIKNIPKNILADGHLTIRGELIMSEESFMANWASTYANARNLTAGVFNRKDSDEDILNDIDFIAYQIVDGSENNLTLSQIGDLNLLESYGFTVVSWESFDRAGNLNEDDLKNLLLKYKAASKYELDGIVITINEKNNRKSLSNSSSINPEHSVKFKCLSENAYVEATVVDVHYELSKNGWFKPRIEIVPVKLFGTTVTYATGFNGKYIHDNGVGPGAIIRITKSGQVIPYCVEVVKQVQPKMPADTWEWNDNGVECVIKDADNHPEVIFKQVLDFFETLEVDLLKEANIKKVISFLRLEDASYETIISSIMELILMEWVNIIGVNGSKIHSSLERRLSSLSLATYLGAVKYFGTGFGVRRAKLLLKNLDDENKVWDLTVDDIVNYEGFDVKTASMIVNGLHSAKLFAEKLHLSFVKEEKTTELSHLNVVFTGFRDKEFQEKLEKLGAKVSSSVSKRTTHLLTAEPNSTSTKAVKARQLGIETLSLDEFKDKFKL